MLYSELKTKQMFNIFYFGLFVLQRLKFMKDQEKFKLDLICIK